MELGSEYNLDFNQLQETQDNIYNYLKEEYILTDSGRGALSILLQNLPKGKVLIPNFICNSVIECFKEEYKIKFYNIHKDLTIDITDIEKKLSSDIKILYIVQYFGKLLSDFIKDKILEWKRKYNLIIIEDTTHSIFSNAHVVGDYCICSLRKWFAIPDGGILYGKIKESIPLSKLNIKNRTSINKVNAMVLKTLYLQEKLECNELYRKIFIEEEKEFSYNTEVQGISLLSKWLLSFYSITDLKNKRIDNMKYFYNKLNNLNYVVKFDEKEVPFTLPIYCVDRDKFRKHLIENNIFCAVHWPISENYDSADNENSIEISRHILSLPIDQRYGINEMDYMINIIKEYI